MSEDNKNRVISMLKENLYMTAAVSLRDGTPWIANLYYVYDEHYNFYWYSSKDSVHSNYIRENPKVALSIFDSTAIGDSVDAIYICKCIRAVR